MNTLVDTVPSFRSRFLFKTGEAFTPRARDFIDGRTDAVLSKPFTRDELREAIVRTPRSLSCVGRP